MVVFHVAGLEFLSTPSARRATRRRTRLRTTFLNFYPRPPRGGRPPHQRGCGRHPPISIHALREEGDAPADSGFIWVQGISIHALREEGDMRHPVFPDGNRRISIHALREEGDRADQPDHRDSAAISIHALREEGDPSGRKSGSPRWNFYPRPPRGGRQRLCPNNGGEKIFLSTPSARRATMLNK